jgi:hypothetical protein
MALPRGATARDYWLDLADEARANREDARAAGYHRMAGLWDAHERDLLRNAYEDAPAPDAGSDEIASAGDEPSTVGEFLRATGRLRNPDGATVDQPGRSSPTGPTFGGLWGPIGQVISEAANGNVLPVAEKTYGDLVKEGKLKVSTPTDLPAEGLISPSKLNAAQSDIGTEAFKGGRPLYELVNELKSGKDPRSIDPVRVFEMDGKLFTLDHRRAYAAELAGVDVHYKLATPEEVQGELWKLSRVPGKPVRLRGMPRGGGAGVR